MQAWIIKNRHIARLIGIMLFVFAVMSALNPTVFLSVANFQSMALQTPELGFLSIAAALVLISGGIDLSVTGTATLSGIVAALTMRNFSAAGEAPLWAVLLACAAALVTGCACGALNAILVARVNIAPMLVTLGTMNLFTGVGIVLTKGSAISKFPFSFLQVGNGLLFGVPIPFLLFLGAIGVLAFFLNKTKLGFKLYVYGTNPVASFYSAINNTKVVFTTYLVSGFVSSVAGLIMVSRVNTAKADFGASYGLQALLVAVLGGIDPSGGYGKALGILSAIVTLQFLSSGFNLLHVSSFLKDLTWGGLLVFIMVLNTLEPHKKHKPQNASKVKE